MNITWENDVPDAIYDLFDRMAEADWVVCLNGEDRLLVGWTGDALEHVSVTWTVASGFDLTTTRLGDIESLVIY